MKNLLHRKHRSRSGPAHLNRREPRLRPAPDHPVAGPSAIAQAQAEMAPTAPPMRRR